MAFEQPDSCADLKLIFGDKTLYFSCYMISQNSETFKNMFADMGKGDITIIDLPREEFCGMQILLRILSDRNITVASLNLSIENYLALYFCADKYEITFIIDECKKYEIRETDLHIILKNMAAAYGKDDLVWFLHKIYDQLNKLISADNIVDIINDIGKINSNILQSLRSSKRFVFLDKLFSAKNITKLDKKYIMCIIPTWQALMDILLLWIADADNIGVLAPLFMFYADLQEKINKFTPEYLNKFDKLVALIPGINEQNHLQRIVINAYKNKVDNRTVVKATNPQSFASNRVSTNKRRKID